MKLIIAILRDSDADNITQALTRDQYRVTRVASTGGFLRRGTVTLLIGVRDERVNSAIEVIKNSAGPVSGDEKRATIFVVPIEHYEQI
jgi:uncharacterized protein YaaQ